MGTNRNQLGQKGKVTLLGVGGERGVLVDAAHAWSGTVGAPTGRGLLEKQRLKAHKTQSIYRMHYIMCSTERNVVNQLGKRIFYKMAFLKYS